MSQDPLTCQRELQAVVRPDGVLARRPGGGAARGGAVLLLRRRGLHRRGRRDLVRGGIAGGREGEAARLARLVCGQRVAKRRDTKTYGSVLPS